MVFAQEMLWCLAGLCGLCGPLCALCKCLGFWFFGVGLKCGFEPRRARRARRRLRLGVVWIFCEFCDFLGLMVWWFVLWFSSRLRGFARDFLFLFFWPHAKARRREEDERLRQGVVWIFCEFL